MKSSEYPHVGVVVPTMGRRSEFLLASLNSIRSAGPAYIIVVAPNTVNLAEIEARMLVDEIVEDPMRGLAAAINSGMSSFPPSLKYVTWLGDDDLLSVDSLQRSLHILETTPSVGFVYGMCEYIDSEGQPLFVSRSGRWAMKLLRYGPQLVPQPGLVMRRVLFEEVGRLNERLAWAFDLELLLKMSRVCDFQYLPEVQSRFRWHSESLSVGSRAGSVAEASRVRREALSVPARLMSPLWEGPLKRLIYLAGRVVGLKVRRSSRRPT